jgi:uncharacterized phage protein (TIGR01671 family)
MREIKFRAWYNNKMVDDEEAKRLLYNNTSTSALFITELDMMQYTGLKDKNGKEIYEGDILDVPELYETPEMTSPSYTKWQVVFKHGMFTLENKNNKSENDSSTLYYEYFAYDGNIEVIGNIFENPELL